jgi:DNA-binding SARP family transcriptional activator
VKTLYSHVVRIRQALDDCGLPDVVSTHGPGYALHLPRQSVDVWLFEDHVRRARRVQEGGYWDRAAHELRTGLGLWRGDAFADGEPAGWGAAEVDRLAEVRLTAHEELWHAELNLGNHSVAAEIERLLVHQRLRARLAADLGVDPGPALQRLYSAMLRRDPDLDLSRTVIPPMAPAPPPVQAAPRWVLVPAQLPRRVGHFTGRTSELDGLDRLLDGEPDDPRIAVISGPAGMGKPNPGF